MNLLAVFEPTTHFISLEINCKHEFVAPYLPEVETVLLCPHVTCHCIIAFIDELNVIKRRHRY